MNKVNEKCLRCWEQNMLLQETAFASFHAFIRRATWSNTRLTVWHQVVWIVRSDLTFSTIWYPFDGIRSGVDFMRIHFILSRWTKTVVQCSFDGRPSGDERANSPHSTSTNKYLVDGRPCKHASLCTDNLLHFSRGNANSVTSIRRPNDTELFIGHKGMP